MAHQLGLALEFYSFLFRDKRTGSTYSIDCINLNSFMKNENLSNITTSIVQQCIEHHIGGVWKDEAFNTNAMQTDYSRRFNEKYLHDIVGPVTNLHIHVDSEQALQYSFDFVRQLKIENPTVQIEMSCNGNIGEQVYQSVIILAFECNQNYVLIYVNFDSFLQYISTCASPEDVQTKVESSVIFGYALSRGQPIKWHRNLSFIYIAAYQEAIIQRIKANIRSRGLQDLVLKTKQLPFLDDFGPPQYRKNQAIICFDFSSSGDGFQSFPSSSQQLNQWVFDQDREVFTGPYITLFPNVSKYPVSSYPKYTMHSDVAGFYYLLCDNVLVLFQWRSFFVWNAQFEWLWTLYSRHLLLKTYLSIWIILGRPVY